MTARASFPRGMATLAAGLGVLVGLGAPIACAQTSPPESVVFFGELRDGAALGDTEIQLTVTEVWDLSDPYDLFDPWRYRPGRPAFRSKSDAILVSLHFGHFEFELPRDTRRTRWCFRFHAAGHLDEVGLCQVEEGETWIDLGEVRLDLEELVAGTVIGPDGEGLAGVEVLHTNVLCSEGAFESRTSDASGSFLFSRIASRGDVLFVDDERFAVVEPLRLDTLELRDLAHCEIRLFEPGRLRASAVRGETGEPVEAAFHLFPPRYLENDFASHSYFAFGRELSTIGATSRLSFLERNRVEVGPGHWARLAPGRYQLHAGAKGFGSETKLIEIGPGETIGERVELLPPPPRTVVVTGTVRTKGGGDSDETFELEVLGAGRERSQRGQIFPVTQGPFRLEFEIPPGRPQIQVVVHGAAGDSVVRPVRFRRRSVECNVGTLTVPK